MHVDDAVRSDRKEVARQHLSERGGNDDVGIKRADIVDAFTAHLFVLQNFQPVFFGAHLDGTRRYDAAVSRAVRLRDNRDYLVAAVNKLFKTRHGKIRRAHKNHSHIICRQVRLFFYP